MPTVLVVDDDSDSRDTLADVLADEGYVVRVTGDAAQALAMLEGGLRPDVVLLDLVMPGMSGDEMLARLRGTEAANVPVIVLSAMHDWRPPEGVMSLRKPATLERVLAAVKTYTGSRA